MIEGKMQKYIWDIFKWKHPELIYVGLVQLEGIKGKLSKSKSQKEVKSGEYIGWNDPRTWSVQSLEQRGILAESLREFVEKIGLNQNEISIPVDELYAINRKHLDKNADRYYFVENPIMISLDILPVGEIEVKIHPEKDKTRKIKLNKEIFVQNSDFKELENKEVRLMHLCNILLTKKARYTSSENKPELRKIHWVSDGVKTRIMMPDGAYSFGIAESAVKKLKPGAIIQFERFGFCRFKGIDKKTKELEFWFAHN